MGSSKLFLRSFFPVISIVLFISSISYAQDLGRWYSMSTEKNVEKAPCLYSSKRLSYMDSTHIDLESISTEILEPTISYVTLSGHPMDDSHLYKGRVYGVRGQIKERDVLIIDANQDWSFKNESLIALPILEKSKEIPYNELYQYPTGLNYDYSIEYDFVLDDQIFNKSSHLGFTVLSKYDSLQNNLYYLDKFKLCFNQQLVANISIEGIDMDIRCFDYLPWVTTVRFGIKGNQEEKTVNIKDPFLQTDEYFYTIDSIDFIHSKVLISKRSADDEKTISLQSESLFSEMLETTDAKSSADYRIVHVWGSWCRPCLRNMPKLIEIQNKYSDLEVIGICVDNKKEVAQKIAKDKSIDWRNLFYKFNEFNKKADLNILTYPTYFVLNRENKIVEKVSSIEKVEVKLEQLLK